LSSHQRSRRAEQGVGIPRGEIRALTGLRAIAAVWVVLLHFQRLLIPYLDQVPLLRAVVSAGWLGVDLFFALSGFVIGLAYLEQVGRSPRPATIGRFALARFARVWPAWAVVTVLMGGWVWALRKAGWNADVLVPHPDADVAQMLRQLSMTHMWGHDGFFGVSYVLPGWSISAEWLAYLCFPLLAICLRPLLHLPAPLVLVLSCLATTPLVVTAYQEGVPDLAQNWLTRISCGFLAGLLAAIAAKRIRRTERTESLALAGSILTVVLMVGAFMWNNWRRGGDLGHDYSGVVVCLLPLLIVSLSFTDRGLASLLGRRPMVYGGRISYCIYLTHFVVLDVVTTVVWQDPEDAWVPTPGFMLAIPLMALAPFLLAPLLHHLVEEPARARIMALVPKPKPKPNSVPVVSAGPEAPAVAGGPGSAAHRLPVAAGRLPAPPVTAGGGNRAGAPAVARVREPRTQWLSAVSTAERVAVPRPRVTHPLPVPPATATRGRPGRHEPRIVSTSA
jgi:peptidoglycan/LPS O-acetylase OafA/YrhL